jgi:ATP-grasp ribosomal peptide maturase
VTVLILAQDYDVSVDLMIKALSARLVPTFRVDTARFPAQLSLDAEFRGGRWVGRLATEHHTVELDTIRSVWTRAPSTFQFPSGLNPSEHQHVHAEAKLGVGGVLLSLPVLFVNRFDRAATASYKPLQLRVAADSGLIVPPTLVTNRGDTVRRFAGEHGEIVTKMLGSNSIIEPDGRKVAFTRRVGSADLDDLRGIEVTAHLMQQHVPKAHDARVIVIGKRLFGFAIQASTQAGTLDFRYDYQGLRYEPVEVPGDVADGVGELMEKLGLCFAAIDFVVTRDDQWVFIGDVNPGGQYGWLESATGAPLTETLADLLADGVARDHHTGD